MSDEANRSTVDNIRELTQASQQLMEAGKQVKDNLTELSARAERSAELGKQIATNPWVLIGAVVAIGTGIILMSRRSS